MEWYVVDWWWPRTVRSRCVSFYLKQTETDTRAAGRTERRMAKEGSYSGSEVRFTKASGWTESVNVVHCLITEEMTLQCHPRVPSQRYGGNHWLEQVYLTYYFPLFWLLLIIFVFRWGCWMHSRFWWRQNQPSWKCYFNHWSLELSQCLILNAAVWRTPWDKCDWQNIFAREKWFLKATQKINKDHLKYKVCWFSVSVFGYIQNVQFQCKIYIFTLTAKGITSKLCYQTSGYRNTIPMDLECLFINSSNVLTRNRTLCQHTLSKTSVKVYGKKYTNFTIVSLFQIYFPCWYDNTEIWKI